MPPRNDEEFRSLENRVRELERQLHTHIEIARLGRDQLEENTIGIARNREAILVIQTKSGVVAALCGFAGAAILAAIKLFVH